MDESKEEIKELNERLKESVCNKLEELLNEGLKRDNVEYFYKLEDIKKDICNEKYWEEKIMRYRTSYDGYEDSYGRRGVPGTGRRYRDGSYNDNYGRRGVPGTGRSRYRGEDTLNDMHDNYQEYSYGRENYGNDEGTMKSLKYMLDSVKEFMKTLEEDATSQEEVEMIKKTAREISER